MKTLKGKSKAGTKVEQMDSKLETCKVVLKRLKESGFSFTKVKNENPDLLGKYNKLVAIVKNPAKISWVSFEALNELANLIDLEVSNPIYISKKAA